MSRLDQAIQMMLSAVRPERPAQANAKREVVAKFLLGGLPGHFRKVNARLINTTEIAQTAAETALKSQAYWLTPEFTQIWNMLKDGYDPELNKLDSEFFSRWPILFVEEGAELVLPGPDGGAACIIGFFPFHGKTADAEVTDIAFWAYFLDGGFVLEPLWRSNEIRAALWAIQQASLTTIEVADFTRKPSRQERRAGKKATVNKVRVVNLRRTVRVGVEDVTKADAELEKEDSKAKREYHSRWIVRGHWRNQRVGPGRTEIQRTFVPPYVKGPEGMPLVERVYKV